MPPGDNTGGHQKVGNRLSMRLPGKLRLSRMFKTEGNHNSNALPTTAANGDHSKFGSATSSAGSGFGPLRRPKVSAPQFESTSSMLAESPQDPQREWQAHYRPTSTHTNSSRPQADYESLQFIPRVRKRTSSLVNLTPVEFQDYLAKKGLEVPTTHTHASSLMPTRTSMQPSTQLSTQASAQNSPALIQKTPPRHSVRTTPAVEAPRISPPRAYENYPFDFRQAPQHRSQSPGYSRANHSPTESSVASQQSQATHTTTWEHSDMSEEEDHNAVKDPSRVPTPPQRIQTIPTRRTSMAHQFRNVQPPHPDKSSQQQPQSQPHVPSKVSPELYAFRKSPPSVQPVISSSTAANRITTENFAVYREAMVRLDEVRRLQIDALQTRVAELEERGRMYDNMHAPVSPPLLLTDRIQGLRPFLPIVPTAR